MDKMAQKSYKNIKYLQAFIVEDHHEVVPYIHTYIGSKQLPFEGLTMIHFDSHPDLLIPIDMPADTVFNKHRLYDTLSIENWILPLVYAGHISTIYWLKPPWCEQIAEQTLQFFVGKCVKTGTIRTTCKENYFISEALYAPEDQLENTKNVSLTVICIKPQLWVDTAKNNTFSSNFSSICDQSVEPENRDMGKRSSSSTLHTDTDCPHNVIHFETNCPQDVVQMAKNREQNSGQTEKNCLQDAVTTTTNTLQNDRHTKKNCPENTVDSETNYPQNTVHMDSNCQKNSEQLTIDACDMKNTMLNESKFKREQISSCCFPKDATNNPPQKKLKQDVKNITNTLRKSRVLSPSVCEQFVRISEKLQGKRYILDIDLDFYSTRNPFKGLYSTEQLRLLSELYKYDKPDDSSSEALQRCVERREKQLAALKDALSVLSTDINATISDLDDKRVSLMKDLIRDLDSSDNDVDFDLVHDAGCTMDDTELPHHVSSEEQIAQLMGATEEILKLLPQPTLVTAARSSCDDYCPAHQVEFIQQSVIQILERAYPSLVVMPTYDPDSEQFLQ